MGFESPGSLIRLKLGSLPTGNGINPRLDSGVRGSMKPKPRSSFQDLMVPSNRMGIEWREYSDAASRGLFVKY
jgi:hypothetical protein